MVVSPVLSCNVHKCAYNKSGECHAAAVNIGPEHARCETFTRSVMMSVTHKAESQVRECQMSACKWNRHYCCMACGVIVASHEDHADCFTYVPRIAVSAA